MASRTATIQLFPPRVAPLSALIGYRLQSAACMADGRDNRAGLNAVVNGFAHAAGLGRQSLAKERGRRRA